jgi:hypothetical protein
MNKFKILITGIFAMGLMTMISCNNNKDSGNTETDAEELPDPQEGGNQERYNINAPDEEIIKLDSSAADTTLPWRLAVVKTISFQKAILIQQIYKIPF